MTETQINLVNELPEFNFPCVERCLPGGTRTFIHSMSFEDAGWVREMALHYTGMKTGRTDFHNLQPAESTLKLLQLVKVCRTSPQGEPTFIIPLGAEVSCLDKLASLLPGTLIETMCYESDSLSMTGYIPTETVEEKQKKDSIKKGLLDIMVEPKTWHHLNYLAVNLLGKPLSELEDGTIGDYMNLLKRHDEATNKLLEAMTTWMTAMAGNQ